MPHHPYVAFSLRRTALIGSRSYSRATNDPTLGGGGGGISSDFIDSNSMAVTGTLFLLVFHTLDTKMRRAHDRCTAGAGYTTSLVAGQTAAARWRRPAQVTRTIAYRSPKCKQSCTCDVMANCIKSGHLHRLQGRQSNIRSSVKPNICMWACGRTRRLLPVRVSPPTALRVAHHSVSATAPASRPQPTFGG